MVLKGLCQDREAVIRALEEALRTPAEYMGAPKFAYRVGAYTVTRDGNLSVADGKAEKGLLTELTERRLIEYSEDGADEGVIRTSSDGIDGRGLSNLVRIVSVRERLINKAVGHAGAFHMAAGFIRELEAERPERREDFLALLGGKTPGATKGIRFGADDISFTGFPHTEDAAEAEAFALLAVKLTEAAARQRWAKGAPKEAENEKYAFRVWMYSIGMAGKEYAEARAALLKRLDGDAAFRTEEQREKALGRRNARKREETAAGQEFILL